MRRGALSASALGLCISVALGCAHIQLQKDTVRQARTLSDIYEQQVLDNLAKFVYDINSLPHFSIADGGTTAVNDQLIGNGSLLLPTGANSILGINGQRQCQEAWTLTPISDPRKLELMRCSYQRAVACALSCGQAVECKNCQQLINSFYTGRADTSPRVARRSTGQADPGMMRPQGCSQIQPSGSAECWHETKATVGASGKTPDEQRSVADLSGITADDLNAGCCWFRVCCAKCIGRHRHDCCKVGEYCGVHVVVEGNIGQEMLSRLTLVMLDLAQYKGLTPKPPYAQQDELLKERQQVNDQIQHIIKQIVQAVEEEQESKNKAKDEQELTAKLKQIETLQKVVEAIDVQLNPGQGAGQGQGVGQRQVGAGAPSPLSTWQKMNILLGPAVPPGPTR